MNVSVLLSSYETAFRNQYVLQISMMVLSHSVTKRV